MDRVTLLGIPLYTMSKNHGMGESVRVFRELGITNTLQKNLGSLLDNGDAPLSGIHVDSGPKNLRNFQHFLRDTDSIRRATVRIGTDGLGFFVGGECSIIVGVLAGLKNSVKGKPGVLWIDAHGDFNTPETTSSGFIGGMALAFACGRGPKMNETLEASRPLLVEENVVHLASRALDPEEDRAMSSSAMKLYSASRIHKDGVLKVADQAASYLDDTCDWMTCHLDVDAIDPESIPAVNHPERSGLSLEEVKVAVEAVRVTGKLKAFDLAGYNASLDHNNTSARELLKLVSEIFG